MRKLSELERRLSEAIAAADPGIGARMESDPTAYLDLVVLTAEANECTGRLLHAAVISARTAGLSWEAIGGSLGMSRQAAQQRFGRGPAETTVVEDSRVLSPLNAFNEMEVLNRAGLYGWHSVGYGPQFHRVEKSDRQWEHSRVFVWSRKNQELEAAGWQRIGSEWFPWAYYARATDRPALPEPVSEDYLNPRRE